jgi:hypothetical protein
MGREGKWDKTCLMDSILSSLNPKVRNLIEAENFGKLAGCTRKYEGMKEKKKLKVYVIITVLIYSTWYMYFTSQNKKLNFKK